MAGRDQNELAEFALELDAGLKNGEYSRRRRNRH
jgi:hypothetical protein